MKLNRDYADLLFRLLFSSIFMGLGAEHLFSDHLIQRLMPEWMPLPRFVSIFSGLVLISGGSLIVLGIYLRWAAVQLGIFLVLVTALVHGPALMQEAPTVHPEDAWLWTVLQRSNYVKNLCLLGVCLMLYHYQPGRFSLQRRREKGSRG